ncbi:MAG: penicillin-binding protein activator LpoB, partial [Deltaproteobacteria bacterium]
KTDEHIDAQVFIKNIERAMIESGRVRVLAQRGSEQHTLEAEQAQMLSGRQRLDSAVKVGEEAGADYVVAVRLASIVDEVEGERAKFYQVNFELIDPSTGEKAWIGEQQIKKYVKQARVRP